jgi:hypothetical protein
MNEFSAEDVGNIVLLEHVNLQVPDQALATIFYIVGLGLTRDPYFNIGVRNMWANAALRSALRLQTLLVLTGRTSQVACRS